MKESEINILKLEKGFKMTCRREGVWMKKANNHITALSPQWSTIQLNMLNLWQKLVSSVMAETELQF